MRWASAVSSRVSLHDAVVECSAEVRTQLGGGTEPDLVLAFVSPHFHAQYEEVPEAVRAWFPEAALLGCTGAGVIGAGREVEDAPGLSITAAFLPGVTLASFSVTGAELPSPDAPPEAWAELTGVEPGATPQFVLLAEPFSLDGEALVEGLDFAFPSAPKIGGLASGGGRPGSHALFLDGAVYREGAIGVALSGNVVIDTVVAQGCRPIGRPMRVTEAQGNLLVKLDDQPALEALQATYEALAEDEQALARRNLFLGLAPSAKFGAGMDLVDDAPQSAFLIRNVIGADSSQGVIAVGAQPREGQLVQFHVRDADSSAEDLRLSLESYARQAGGAQAAGALLFSCTGRGAHLYGTPGHDSGIFRDLVGTLPLGGFFCNGEFGPVNGTTYLHGYTSSFGIFRPITAPD